MKRLQSFVLLATLALSSVVPAAAASSSTASGFERSGAAESFRIERDGDAWSVWQGGVLRWRASGPVPDQLALGPGGPRVDSLALIASWQCSGNVSTGGQLHTWDLNGNGIPDLAYGNWQYTTYVYEAIGDNQFQQKHQLSNPVGSYYTTLRCAGDGDSDGKGELIFGSGTSGVPRNLYFVESRRPNAYPDSIVLVLPEVNIGVTHMRMGDLDGDGRREYVGATQGTHDKLVAIWENRGDNQYTQVFSAHFGPVSAVSGEIALGDFDGDGRGDLVVPENGNNSIIHVLESGAGDTYPEVWSAVAPTSNMYWVTPGPDLDRDGRGDFVVTGGVGGGRGERAIWSFLMYEAIADNTYALVWSYQASSNVIDGGCATGDIDGDGWNELLAQVPTRTMVFRATGDNQLALIWDHAGPVQGQGEHRIVAPDLDRDRKGEAIWWLSDNPGTLVLYERVGLPPGGVDDQAGLAGPVTILYPNSPNPFEQATTIRYALPVACHVNIDVYDISGRRITTLLDATRGAGPGSVRWEPGRCPAGIYLCRLNAGGIVETRRMVLGR